MSDDETPYAHAVRLLESGGKPADVVSALKAKGLSADDVETLLTALARTSGRDALRAYMAALPPAKVEVPQTAAELAEVKARDDRVSGQNLVMGLALLVIGGAILVVREGASRLGLITALVGITGIVSSFTRPRRLLATPPLPDDDPSPRCAVHPRLASAGTCPRCGRFACTACAPAGGFRADRVCLTCSELPAYRAEQASRAAKRVSIAMMLIPVPLLVLGGLALAFPTHTAVGLAMARFGAPALAASVPFIGLGLVQRQVGHPWPAFLCAGLAACGMIALMGLTDGAWDESMAFVVLPAVVPLFLLGRSA